MSINSFGLAARAVLGENPLMSLTESRFQIFRCLIGLAYIDGYMHPDEKKIIEQLIDAERVSPAQREILLQDMVDAPDYEAHYIHVVDKRDRHDLFRFARALFKIDGLLSEPEREALIKLEAHTGDHP